MKRWHRCVDVQMCRHAGQRCTPADLQMCRHEGAEVQRCRDAEMQRCRGAEVQRYRGTEVQSRCIGAGF